MALNEERGERRAEGATLAGPATPQRAASELHLHQEEGAHTPDAASLQDEPLMDGTPGTSLSRPVSHSNYVDNWYESRDSRDTETRHPR